jgi:hypothetical protein
VSGRATALPAAGDLAVSVLRDLLLEGPAGIDPVGLALVGLLDAAGLLADPAFVEACVDVVGDPVDGTPLYAEVDLDRLLAASLGDTPLRLAPAGHQLLSTAVGLVDLARGLRTLAPAAAMAAAAALAGFVQAVGPQTGLSVSLSTSLSTSPTPSTCSTSSSGAPVASSSLAAEVSGWSAARRLAGDLQRLDDLVVAAWQAEEALTELRAGQVGVVAEAVLERDRLLIGLIALVRGVPLDRVAATSPAASSGTAATCLVPSTAGGAR